MGTVITAHNTRKNMEPQGGVLPSRIRGNFHNSILDMMILLAMGLMAANIAYSRKIYGMLKPSESSKSRSMKRRPTYI